MAATAERNPFRPGPGTWPPVLAGRESERSALGAIVSDLLLHRADPIHLMEAPAWMDWAAIPSLADHIRRHPR